MGIIDSATNAASTAATIVSGSPATALSSAKDAVSGVTGAMGGLGSTLKTVAPLPNPLSSYATYDYILGLTVLKQSEVNTPDATYIKNGRFSMPMICKSANTQPNNRVNTAYGKFDFFIDSLTINSTIGFNNYKNSSVQTLSFDVVEPYSALMFPLALQTAAFQAGWPAWRGAVFLLSIEFRGNKENGTMQNIPGINRYLPVRLQTMQINVSEKGTSYHVEAVIANDYGKAKEFAEAKTDVSIKGKTIQEILQTGEQSLQVVVNKRLQELKDKKIVNDPDEIVILFPENIESSALPSQPAGQAETKSAATTSSTASQSSTEITKKLGVSVGANKTLVQPDGQCNAIGKAASGASTTRKGNTPMSKPVYKAGNYDQTSVTATPNEATYAFAQLQDIPSIINEVIMSSDYVTACLDKSKLDSRGMRDWWTIDTQVYYKSTTANLDKTGTESRIIVYRVFPYKAHASSAANPNTKIQGFDVITKTVVKKYDYIYTGKNTEVLKFDIDYSLSFSNLLAADSGLSNIDTKIKASASNQAEDKESKTSGLSTGNKPEQGTTPTSIKPQLAQYSTERQGGSNLDTPATRAARAFHDSITKSVDMMKLSLEIMGDPFWIPTSGMGNYTAPPGDRPGVTKDGGVDYQRSQVDVYVNFRTPIDINQNTGLYDFGKSSKSGPVIEFSGLYNVLQTVSTFKGGRFTQTLIGNRRMGVDRKKTDTPDKAMNTSMPDPSQAPESTELRTQEEIQASKDLGNFMG